MGLTKTVGTVTSRSRARSCTPSAPNGAWIGIPPTGTFYEEATYWNTQWGTPMGANQTTTIDDMITTASPVGTGDLLSQASYEAMTTPS